MATRKEILRQLDQENRLTNMGLCRQDAELLRKCSLTLASWNKHLCNDTEIYETDGKAYRKNYNGKHRYRVSNLGPGAEKRALAIIAKYPELAVYFQADPRGAAIYIYFTWHPDAAKIDSCYSSFALAVY